MKKLLLWMMIAVIFPFSYSLAEDMNDRIIVIDGIPASTGENDNREPYKPDHLAEAEKVPIDTDKRIVISEPEKYPFSAIAYIDVTPGCGHSGWYGTGFMIEKNLLMTAGHCVYCPECHAPAQEIAFYFGYRNARNYIACNKGSNWRVYVSRQVAEGKDYQMYDYAVFQLDEDIGKKTGYFKLRHDVPDAELAGASFHVTGYRDGILRIDTDRVEPLNERYLIHYADTEAGNSGCPVYDDDYSVIAINTAEGNDGTRNYAVRITGDIYAMIEAYGKK